MCKSKAQGGKRCHYHLDKAYVTAVGRVAGLPADASAGQVEKARGRYEKSVAALASDPAGLAALRKRAAAIEAGDTPAGDDLTVLRRYAPPKVPSQTAVSLAEAFDTGMPVREDLRKTARPMQTTRVERGTGEYASDLAEALAHNKPMPPEHRVAKGPRPVVDSGFAAALRGDTPAAVHAPDPYAGPFTFDGGELRSLPEGRDETAESLLDPYAERSEGESLRRSRWWGRKR